MRLVREATLLGDLRQAGQREAQQRFSVMASAKALEAGFKLDSAQNSEIPVF